jgi:DNA-binding Xre family transcriptional regulator
MLVIRDLDAIASITDPALRQLVQQRTDALVSDGDTLEELCHFIVVEPGDSIEAIDAQLGFSILSNRWDGLRFGDPAFKPAWEILEDHLNYFEVVFVLGDDGYGVEVFVPKQGIAADLLAMLSLYATPEQART